MLPADIGDISDRISFRTPVIPAKAGIQSVGSALPMLVTALSENRGLIRKRKKPAFEMGRELKFTFPR